MRLNYAFQQLKKRRSSASRWALTNRHVITTTLLVALATYLLFTLEDNYSPEYIRLPTYVDISNYELLQPDVFEDFPTVEDGTPKIPHIIHQTAPSTCISPSNVGHIKSFIRHNPDWDYFFWTDAAARVLIKYQRPDLLDIWDNVEQRIKKADILRYMVLYEFGGIYADVDVENIRPLDRVTRKYSCIIPTEPFEHSAFLYNRPFMINNGIMFCSKGHPFFKQLLDNLKYKINDDVMSATGPVYVTEQFIKYNKNMHKNNLGGPPEDFVAALGSGAYEETDERAVYVPNTHYFTDTIDIWSQGKNLSVSCREFSSLNNLRQRACIDLVHKGLSRTNTQYAYTLHHWYHSWCTFGTLQQVRNFISSSCVDIHHIVPHELLFVFNVTLNQGAFLYSP